MPRSHGGSELERLVRYCHPAKLLGTTRLPGLAALDEPVVARLYGTSPETYREVAAELRAQARRAAHELSEQEAVRAAIESLPLAAGDTVLALGDSHTDDLGSWAEILGHLFALVRPRDAIRLVNAGVSGDTTTAALARTNRLPPAALAVVLLGTNDARRSVLPGAPMLVSHAETARNLRAIDAMLVRTCRRVAWVTPPPVDQQRIDADRALTDAGVTYAAADVEEKARLVRGIDGDAVDLWPVFRVDHLAGDGLHPNPAGQRLIVDRVLRRSGRTALRAG